MGKNITISHNGTFIFSDGHTPVSSTDDGQFIIYATGNVGIGTIPSKNITLSVGNVLKAVYFEGDGSRLFNISATRLNGFSPQTTASPNSIYVSDANGYLPEGSVSGLSIADGSITSIDIKDNTITGDKIKQLAITADKIQEKSITNSKIADGAITSDKIQSDAITSTNIKDASIVSKNLAPDSVQTHHIAANQVTNAKIAIDTIDSSRIVDGTVTSKDIGLGAIASINIDADAIQAHHIARATIISDNIAVNAIQSQHIAEKTVSSRNIADNAIYSNHIVDGNIESRHIKSNAITSTHIDNNVIINSYIVDNSITSDKIANNSIRSEHIPGRTINSDHIDDNAIMAQHIFDGQIDGSKLADGAVTSINIQNNAISSAKIADNAVLSTHIKDGTIVSADIALNSIPNSMLAENSITSKNIAVGGIASSNIAPNSITSVNIVDGSIVSADIKDDTIVAATALTDGSITSDKISDGAIQNQHIADNAITSRNIADGSVPWSKITTAPIPTSSIADGSIPGSKLKESSIPGSKIIDASITASKLADNSISTNALDGILAPDKGGTGLTQSDLNALSGSIIMGIQDGGNVKLGGDKTKLSWDNVNQRLGINIENPLAALHVSGNLLTTGGVYFGSMDNSISFGENAGTGFIIVGPDVAAGQSIDANTEPKGTLKTNKLFVADKVGIGVQSPTNKLDVSGNMSIGAGFVGKSAPDNGLIVEGNVGIGTATPAHALDVSGSIMAKGIIGESTDTNSGIGIKGIGGKIGIQSVNSETGIEVSASKIGMKLTSTGNAGAYVVVKNASANDSTGLLTELKDSTGTLLVSGGLAKLTNDYAASVFGSAPVVAGKKNWAAYFDGPVRITGNVGVGLLPNQTPDAALHVKGNAKFEKGLYTLIHDLTGTTIDWNKGNKLNLACSSTTSLGFTDPTKEGSYVLKLVIKPSNANCKISFSSSDIKWENGTPPSTDAALNQNSTYIYAFFFQKTASAITYYGLKPLEFKAQ